MMRERRLLATFVLGALCACGGGTSPSGSSSNGTPGAASTFTITSSGVSPKNIVVHAGAQVTFVNNDAAHHLMFSDPHPEHTDCPEINQVGFLNPGDSRQSGNLIATRVCGFHDHDDAENSRWRGTITIQ